MEGKNAVVQQQTLRLPLERGDELRVRRGKRLLPARRRGGNEVLVIEERTSEGGMEEPIAHQVLPGQQALGQVRGVVVALHQAAVIAPGDELVHRTVAGREVAVIDLQLLGVEGVDQVLGLARDGHVLRKVVRPDGQSGRNVGIGGGIGQSGQRPPCAIDLRDGGGRVVQAVGPGELAVQAVEAPVLLVDHDPVFDVGQAGLAGGVAFGGADGSAYVCDAGGWASARLHWQAG